MVASKASIPRKLVRGKGVDEFGTPPVEPVERSLTIRVPVAVPSLVQSSVPLAGSEARK